MSKKEKAPPPTPEQMANELRDLRTHNLLLEESVRRLEEALHQRQRETGNANERAAYLRRKLDKTERMLAVLISTHLKTLVDFHEGKGLDIHDMTGE